MKIRRIAASINACFEDLVSKVENHGAVAQVMIEDVQKAAAKIRMEKLKVEQNMRALEEQQNKLQASMELWQSRAKACANENEEKALQCLRQSKKAKIQSQHIAQQYDELSNLATQLAESLSEVESKLNQLKSKKAILATRESRAVAIGKSQRAQRELNGLSVDDVFNRWELNILQSEYQDEGNIHSNDSSGQDLRFAKDFEEEEERLSLLSELDDLKTEIASKGAGE